MKLPEHEIAYLKRLRKSQKNVARLRWLRGAFLLTGVAVLLAGLKGPIGRILADDQARVLVWPVVAPLLVFIVGVFTWVGICAIREWNGNMSEALLLRLVDELDAGSVDEELPPEARSDI